MERGVKECCGLNFKSVSFGELFLNKTMLFAYLLLAIGLIGWIQIYGLRFGHDFVNVKDMIGVDADNAKQLALAMKEQIFGMHHIEEVPRTEPWGIFVANYMFMLYTGSAIILLVAIGELLHMKNVEKIAPLFSLFGLAMVLGGMTSIASDWGNPINMYNMFLHPQLHSGMWMMLPLYLIYIPFTIIEIYFMMTTNREKARKVAGILLIVGILIEFAEFYIQSILFSLNVPRHLWTFDSFQPFYLIITGFTAAFGVLAILSTFVLKNKPYYSDIMGSIRKGAIAWIIILGIYELYAGSIMPADYKENMINGLFKNWFMIGFIGIGTILPLLLLAKKSNVLTILAGVFLIIGAFINRCLFVYGGNSVPMTNRFGIGPEAFSTYNVAEIEKAIFEAPHTMEILIIIGCLGVSIAIYKLLDTLLDVSNPPH
jgi:Ni/Fe-hydrogenase subunit HybB-like protein